MEFKEMTTDRWTRKSASELYDNVINTFEPEYGCWSAIQELVARAKRYDYLTSNPKMRQGTQILGGERTISRNRDQDLMRFDFWCTPEELASRIDKEISNGKPRT